MCMYWYLVGEYTQCTCTCIYFIVVYRGLVILSPPPSNIASCNNAFACMCIIMSMHINFKETTNSSPRDWNVPGKVHCMPPDSHTHVVWTHYTFVIYHVHVVIVSSYWEEYKGTSSHLNCYYHCNVSRAGQTSSLIPGPAKLIPCTM